MSIRAFIDTNIFIYIQRTDNPLKKQIAEKAIHCFDCVASTQVLNEISNVFTKKYPMPVEKIERLLNNIAENAEVITVSETLIRQALHVHDRYQIPYFDSLMIVAALYAHCAYLISEDMQDGLLIDGKLKIVNVFNHADILHPDEKSTTSP